MTVRARRLRLQAPEQRDKRDLRLSHLVKSQQRIERLVWQILWVVVVLGTTGLALSVIRLFI